MRKYTVIILSLLMYAMVNANIDISCLEGVKLSKNNLKLIKKAKSGKELKSKQEKKLVTLINKHCTVLDTNCSDCGSINDDKEYDCQVLIKEECKQWAKERSKKFKEKDVTL